MTANAQESGRAVDSMDLVAADAIILLDGLAAQIKAVASEMVDSLHASMFMVVANDLRGADSRLRVRVRTLATLRTVRD